MATKAETAAERLTRLRREAAEQTAKLQAAIAEAERAVAVEEAATSLSNVVAAVQAGRVGEVSDWVVVLGLAPDEALRKAGFSLKAPGSDSKYNKTSGTRAARLSVDYVREKVPSGPFTVADLAKAIDRQDATTRNFVKALLADGTIKEAGLDESAEGPRKPMLYTKTKS